MILSSLDVASMRSKSCLSALNCGSLLDTAPFTIRVPVLFIFTVFARFAPTFTSPNLRSVVTTKRFGSLMSRTVFLSVMPGIVPLNGTSAPTSIGNLSGLVNV